MSAREEARGPQAEPRTAGEHRSLMADLRAAAEKDQPALLYAPSVKRLLALLEAGRACRDELGAHCGDPNCGEPPCVLIRRYDEAAK